MVNAAVPLEAYDASAACNEAYLPTTGSCGALARNPGWSSEEWPGGQPNPMVAWPDWAGQTTGNFYDPKTWSANYYQLFADTPADVRSQLTWRGLFQDDRLLSIAYNFYSAGAGDAWYSQRGDEVFQLHPTLPWGVATEGWDYTFDIHAWQKQESCKGGHCGFANDYAHLGASPYAGWGMESISVDKANQLVKSLDSGSEEEKSTALQTLRLSPVFRHNPREIFDNVSTLTAFPAIAYPQDSLQSGEKGLSGEEGLSSADRGLLAIPLNSREAILALAIPALSPAAGGAVVKTLYEFGDRNINLDQVPGLRNGWPRNDGHTYKTRWLHTDLKDVAYLYTYPFYQKMVELGHLNIE